MVDACSSVIAPDRRHVRHLPYTGMDEREDGQARQQHRAEEVGDGGGDLAHSASARRTAPPSSAICRCDTSADTIACDPWKVPAHWCSSTDTPAWSRRNA